MGQLLGSPPAHAAALPSPGRSGIDHIVVVMMENRSFDHFLGWLPGADGKQAGLTFVDRVGRRHSTFHQTRVRELRLPRPRPLLRGRPDRAQRRAAATAGCGPARTTCSRSATTSKADLAFLGQPPPTGPPATATSPRCWPRPTRTASTSTRARTDRLHNSTTISTLPTIWDRLRGAGPSAARTTTPTSRSSRCGARSTSSISQPFATFLADCGDRHPARRVASSTRASRTRLRHLRRRPPARRHPRRRGVPQPGLHGGHDRPGLGQHPAGDQLRRVGRLLRPRRARHGAGRQPGDGAARLPGAGADRSRRAPGAGTSPTTVYDHTSVLQAIEWRWGLPPLTPRDAHAHNIAEVLDFPRRRTWRRRRIHRPAVRVGDATAPRRRPPPAPRTPNGRR